MKDKPILVRRKCFLNCKSEGPPGPIWCTECGHDPKCCNCEIEYEDQEKIKKHNEEGEKKDASKTL